MVETKQASCCAPSCCSGSTTVGSPRPAAEELVQVVRERYGQIASGGVSGCCGESASGPAAVTTALGYDARDLAAIPEEANLGLGCGAPLAFLDLQPGETVLDLGSGAGIDVFIAARRVGPQGHVIGVDMTPAMLERARTAAAKQGFANVEFREGRLEALPVADASIDAVTSNCVVNLVPDKKAVFHEVARVLRPGGRLVISDIVLDGSLPAAVEKDLLAYCGCVAGALRREAYFALVGAAGLQDVEVLRDVDQMASLAEVGPEELRELQERTGVALEDMLGRVKSVTFRAVRPGAI
jgi:arsenite methyltransferase